MNSESRTEAKDRAEREPLSAFVICYNEENNIGDCLNSLDFCDEIVVVDAFSTDRTVEIAEGLGAQVIQKKWAGHREQKEFALAKTSNEWVLNIDADERVSAELRSEILDALAREYKARTNGGASPEIAGYCVNRLVYFLDRWWCRGGWYPEYRLRLIRKSKAYFTGVDPHEKVMVRGKTRRLGGHLHHYTYKDLDEQFRRLYSYAARTAELQFKAGKIVRSRHLIVNPLARVFKFYVMKRGYREGMAGLVVAIAEGFYTFMKYARLWELGQLSQLCEGGRCRDGNKQ